MITTSLIKLLAPSSYGINIDTDNVNTIIETFRISNNVTESNNVLSQDTTFMKIIPSRHIKESIAIYTGKKSYNLSEIFFLKPSTYKINDVIFPLSIEYRFERDGEIGLIMSVPFKVDTLSEIQISDNKINNKIYDLLKPPSSYYKYEKDGLIVLVSKNIHKISQVELDKFGDSNSIISDIVTEISTVNTIEYNPVFNENPRNGFIHWASLITIIVIFVIVMTLISYKNYVDGYAKSIINKEIKYLLKQ